MTHTLAEETHMITHPVQWPHMNLPLINRETRESAVFGPSLSRTTISEDESITILIGANIWLPSAWSECEQKTYENVAALLADGWRVD